MFPAAASAALLASAALGAEARLCEPSLEIQRELVRAAAAAPADALFDRVAAPFRALRDRFPGDLFVHVRFQDVVADNGIEGHVKDLLAEYSKLRLEHPGDLFYLYLHGRALEGRVTPLAIATMNEILARDPDFAPAQRTLAEIYGSAAFRDRKREGAARIGFEAACPGSVVARRPSPLPPHSTLFTNGPGLLERTGAPDDVRQQVERALQQDEWRSQRMRPFDWYTAAEKKEAVRELQAEYWQGWRILVRHYRRIGKPDEADQLLSEMEQRLSRLQEDPGSKLFWPAAAIVLDLYSQGRQPEKVAQLKIKYGLK
jgi:hypothetical protein